MDYSKQYYEKNREIIILYNINYYWTHREYKQQYNKQDYLENKDIINLRRRTPKITRKQKIMNIINNNKVHFN
jgi:hypothetical protein